MVFRPKSDFLNIMISRGFISDCTDYEGLDHLLKSQICPGYIGLTPQQNLYTSAA